MYGGLDGLGSVGTDEQHETGGAVAKAAPPGAIRTPDDVKRISERWQHFEEPAPIPEPPASCDKHPYHTRGCAGCAAAERQRSRRAQRQQLDDAAHEAPPTADVDAPQMDSGQARDREASGVASAETLLAGMRDGTWLDAQEFAPLEWTVENIVPEGFGLLVAPPKAGKSWLVAGIGLACAAGGCALGKIPVKQRPVLYLALEDGDRRLQSRFRMLMDPAPIPTLINRVISAEPHKVPGMIAEYLVRHQGSKPLVILDTLGKVKPPKRSGEDSYSADYAFGSKLKALADSVPGSTLLAVHHTRKAESADFIDAVSGTQGIAGSADFVLVLTRKRKDDRAVLAVTGRDVAENEYALLMDNGKWNLDGMDLLDAAATVDKRRNQQQTDRLGDRSNEYLDFVGKRPAGTRPADLAKEFKCTPNEASTYLQRLYNKGLIDKRGRGVYMPMRVSEVSDRGTAADTESHTRSAAAPDAPVAVSDPELPPELDGHRESITQHTSHTPRVKAAPPPPRSVTDETVSCVIDTGAAARARTKALEMLTAATGELSPREMKRKTSKETRSSIGEALETLAAEGIVTRRVTANRKVLFSLADRRSNPVGGD
ncbi:AAA family ATPase [Nocardia nova]|uniref:AAA family ATPase n=1 Tax=Nocardia nova TaxID=37330 RepID=UPI001FE93BBD|nr:AAA family ATPase [Nocardia nova]